MDTTPARPTDRRQRIIDAIERLHDTGGVYALDYGEAGRIADAVIAADTAHAAEVRAAAYRLDQIRDAAQLHRQQLISTSELYAVIDAAADLLRLDTQLDDALWDAIATPDKPTFATQHKRVCAIVAAALHDRVTPLRAELKRTEQHAAEVRAAALDAAADALEAEPAHAYVDHLTETGVERVPCLLAFEAVNKLRRMATAARPDNTGAQRPVSLGTPCARCGHSRNWHESGVCIWPDGTPARHPKCGCRDFTPDNTGA